MRKFRLPLALAAGLLTIGAAHAADTAAPGGQAIPDNVAQKSMARLAACQKIGEVYRTLITAPIPGGRDLGVTGTVFRQNTLERLLIIAWTQNCDMGPMLQAEFAYIENVLTVSTLNTPQQRQR